MAIVAGVDFGTLSVRVSIVDSERGRLGSATADYPLHRRREDPNHATQGHADQMRALAEATRGALAAAGVSGSEVQALAVDATGSSVIPVDESLQPIGDYYLWCDHRSWQEALQITETAHRTQLKAIDWSGGAYSSEWGFSKVLHWLRHNPDERARFATALENCDMVVATLCNIKSLDELPRSICAMGHKWMWNESLGGLPPNDFWVQVDPVLDGIRDRIKGRYRTSDTVAGELSPEWADKLGLRAGIPVPVGALDAHWDAIGAGCKVGDVVNVVGTSTCMMAISDTVTLIPGLCGVVAGSVHPGKAGYEAGLSATGDLFSAIAQRANSTVATLSEGLDDYRPGQTGLLRLTWDNGDRTVLVNPELTGVTFGWNLQSTAQDELFAAIEGTAFHTRIILERMEEYGVPVRQVINGGGIPQRSQVLNRVYAGVFGKPVLVPEREVTSLGSAIFAFLAAGAFKSVEAAQEALCPTYRTVEATPEDVARYQELYELYREAYFSLGKSRLLPTLRRLVSPAT